MLWILLAGLWDDDGVWMDDDVWNDGGGATPAARRRRLFIF